MDATFAADYNVYMGGGGGAAATWGRSTARRTPGLAAWQSGQRPGRPLPGDHAKPIRLPAPGQSPTTPGSTAALAQYCPVQGAAGTAVMTGGTNLQTTYSIAYGTLDFLGNTLPANPAFVGCMSVYGSPPNAYAATVYSLNPVMSFRLAEPSGTVAYDNALSMGISALTSVTLGASVLNPIDNGPSATFNGTSSVATSPGLAATYSPTAFSLEIWVYPTTVAPALTEIVNFHEPASDAFNLLLATDSLRFLARDSVNACQAHPTTYVATANTLMHVVGVWPGGNTLAIYVDGVSVQLTYDNTATPSPQFTFVSLGNQVSQSRFFQGNLGPVNAYMSALSAGQVMALYEAGLNGGAGPALLMGV